MVICFVKLIILEWVDIGISLNVWIVFNLEWYIFVIWNWLCDYRYLFGNVMLDF